MGAEQPREAVETLEAAIARLEELRAGAFPGPYEPGYAPGNHWYLFHDREAVAYVTANDGSDEEQREPTARLLAALSRTVVPILEFLRDLHERYSKMPPQPEGWQPAAPTGRIGLALARAILGEVEHD